MRRETIIEALSALENEHGSLTPRQVVEAARDSANPLHDCFEWDDTIAAEKHRLNTARSLLRVKVEFRVRHIPMRAPAYVHDPELSRGVAGYRNVTRIASEADIAHSQLVDEFGRVGAALKRARRLAEIYDLGQEVEALEARVSGLRETLQERGAQPVA